MQMEWIQRLRGWGTTSVVTGNFFDFRLLIEGDCVDIIQPDIPWLGGITEVREYIGREGSLRYVGTLAGVTEVCGYIGWGH